jgi:hypothetical protein
MDKTLKIVIILVCVSAVLLAIVGWVFLPTYTRFLNQTQSLFSLPDTRGLRLNPYYTRSYFTKYPIVENNGKDTAVITRFYDEYNRTIYGESRFMINAGTPDSFYMLPSGYFIQLTMDGALFYSHEIHVEFSDGYKCKLGNI